MNIYQTLSRIRNAINIEMFNNKDWVKKYGIKVISNKLVDNHK